MKKTTSISSGLLAMAAVMLIAAPAWGQQLDEWDAVRIALGDNPSQQATELETSAARESLEKILAWDFDKIIIAHGELIDKDAHHVARKAWRQVLDG